MRIAWLITFWLALFGCTKRTTVEAAPAPLPLYEQDLVGLVYGSLSYGDFNTRLEFTQDQAGLVAVLSRIDGLLVEFDVQSEFFPFSGYVPAYLVLTPRTPWTIEPYVTPSTSSYPPLLLDCDLYTQGGTVWPPSGFDNFAQTDPVWPFFFFRIW